MVFCCTVALYHARDARVPRARPMQAAASKIQQYEELVNESLKVELQAVHDERDAIYDKSAKL